MKKFTKRFVAALASAIMIISSAVSVSAEDYVWYSDSDIVRYHKEIPEIRLKKMYTTSKFTRSLVEDWINTAATNWRTSNTYSIPNTFTSGNGTGDINFIAGKPQTLADNYGIDFIGSNGKVVNGRTITNSTTTATVSVDGVSKKVKKTTSATIYVMNKLSSGTYTSSETGEEIEYSSRSITGHKNTVAHELGHALGYAGHSLYDEDLMASGTSNKDEMSITDNDRQHIGQFWNKYSSASTSTVVSRATTFSEWRALETERAASIDFVGETTAYVDNIIVGTPVEITQGSLDVLDASEEDCEYLLTEYKFRVSDYLFGNQGDKIITVRSQIGNAFELGKEYTISTRRINNALFDIYTVNSHKWILDNSIYTTSDLSSLAKNISSKRSLYAISRTEDNVAETTVANSTFMENNVDLAFVATITNISEDTVNDIIDVNISDVNILKGNVDNNVLTESIRIKGDVVVGGRYLMMFTKNEDGDIMIVARDNSIIDITSSDYGNYIDALEVA